MKKLLKMKGFWMDSGLLEPLRLRFDLPCTRPLNQIRGFENETKAGKHLQSLISLFQEAQRTLRTRENLRQLGAKKDLLNLDSYLLERLRN